MDYALLILTGVIIGLVASLLGTGAGILSILVISYYLNPASYDNFDFVRVLMTNNALFGGVLFLLISIRNIKVANISVGRTSKIAIVSIPISLALAYFIVQYDWLSPAVFYLLFSATVLFSIYTLLTHTEHSFLNTCQHEGTESTGKYLGFGFVSGLFQGITSTESSTVLVPFLNRFCDLKIEKAVTTATASIGPTLIAFSVAMLTLSTSSQNISLQWSSLIPLWLGSAVGLFVPFGTLSNVGLKTASYTFSFFLFIIAIRILFLQVFSYDQY